MEAKKTQLRHVCGHWWAIIEHCYGWETADGRVEKATRSTQIRYGEREQHGWIQSKKRKVYVRVEHCQHGTWKIRLTEQT